MYLVNFSINQGVCYREIKFDVAKKKIKTQADIDDVVNYIKAELEKELASNDEIDLD